MRIICNTTVLILLLFSFDLAAIGDQNKEYLVKVLKDIRSGAHEADIYNLMQKTLSRLSHEDLEAISE